MLRRLVMPVAFALVTSAAHAVGWSKIKVTITSYHTTTSGYLFLDTSNNQNPDSCSTPGTLLISGDTTYRFVVATVMAAQSSGQTVQLFYDGCSGGGTIGYPIITSVAVPHL
jgi:hypothetical protein